MDSITKLFRDPLFDRTIGELRAKGGYAAEAAAKADEFIASVRTGRGEGGRKKFRFTRNGEHRIRNCRKVDLGCGYRIVCVQKDGRLVLLYIGTHDDCFRWIERRRTAEYDLHGVPEEAWLAIGPDRPADGMAGGTETEEARFCDAYEAALMERIDDAVLRRVFAGLVDR
jgi:hypothetical protein